MPHPARAEGLSKFKNAYSERFLFSNLIEFGREEKEMQGGGKKVNDSHKNVVRHIL